MTWMPSADPVLGDSHSCNALELVVVPRTRDIGAFKVRRALPFGKRQMVGPFIFFDQFGPMQFITGQGMDVGAHPHIGLSTVTYLFDGRVMHRDSQQHIQEIAPGAMNLMTAGKGIAHSERTPRLERAAPHSLFGIQSWIALPVDREEIAPSFQHFDAAILPTVEDAGWRARVIAGSAFGRTSPVETTSEWFYAELVLEQGATAPLDPDYEDRAIYVVDGEVDISGEKFEGPQLLIFRPGDRITIRATRPTRVMLLGPGTSRHFAAMHDLSAFDAVDGSSTRHVSAMDVGAVKAPTIRRSYPCRRSRQSVSTSRSRSSRCTALMLPARWSFAAS